MSSESDVTRRVFLERLALGASAIVGLTMATAASGDPPTQDPQAQAAFDAGAFGVPIVPDPPAASIPSPVTNPNILILMVDQLRPPFYWLNSAQQNTVDTTIAPNIANIRKNSVSLPNCYAAATNCTPSRSAMLTGLYAPQTAMFLTQGNVNNPEPNLNTGFPTFASALQVINQNYKGNVFWYGKWHVSNLGLVDSVTNPDTVPEYGFNTGTVIPDWPDTYGSPIGTGNEGSNGIFNSMGNQTVSGCGSDYDVDWAASDVGIANSFIRDSILLPTANWCVAVSFINPHDMSQFPKVFPPGYGIVNANSRAGLPYDCLYDFYPANSNYATELFNVATNQLPVNWNYETNVAVGTKNLSLQSWYLNHQVTSFGWLSKTNPTPSFVDFLNWYYFLISKVDTQIGLVLNKVFPSTYLLPPDTPTFPLSNNTAVILFSDHGEYAGSHGLWGKGGAVYDEAIQVPLCVMLPGQVNAAARNQMCSLVDFSRLILEFGNGGGISNWTIAPYNGFSDQSQRESIFNYCYYNTPEQFRLVNIAGQSAPVPYVLTTTDEFWPPADCSLQGELQSHVIAMRTKSWEDLDVLANFYTGAKYGLYSAWRIGGAPVINAAVSQQYEYYDYHYLRNRSELGNDNTTSNVHAQAVLYNMSTALGNGPVYNGVGTNAAYGLIATELMKPLQGVNMMAAQNEAYNAYNNYVTTVLIPVCYSTP